MNEQFERLALRAGFNLHNDIMDGHSLHHEIEKFAQLIVQECAGKVDFILREKSNGGGTMGDKIREHFGVEE